MMPSPHVTPHCPACLSFLRHDEPAPDNIATMSENTSMVDFLFSGLTDCEDEAGTALAEFGDEDIATLLESKSEDGQPRPHLIDTLIKQNQVVWDKFLANQFVTEGATSPDSKFRTRYEPYAKVGIAISSSVSLFTDH